MDSETTKFVPTQAMLDATAEKYGFPEGKWVTAAGGFIECEYIAIESPLGWKPAIACTLPPCNLWPECVALHIDQVRALSKAFVELPLTLCERDHLAIEVEALREQNGRMREALRSLPLPSEYMVDRSYSIKLTGKQIESICAALSKAGVK